MGLILNCLDEDNKTTVGGNTFSFAPRQIKLFYNNDIASMISRNKKYEGFIDLPDELEYLCHLRPGEKIEDRILPEHVPILMTKREEGIGNYVSHLNAMVMNAQVSLARDLARADYKYDAKYEYSEGDIRNMEQLVKYRTKKEDSLYKKVDKATELEKKLAETKR